MNSHANGNHPLVYVLDSFALLCYLAEEPGFERVTQTLQSAQTGKATVYLSMINLGEVIYISEREHGLARAQEVLLAIDELPALLLEATRERVLAAAHLKANYAISYADAFAVAAAQEFQAIVISGDPEFQRVAHLVQIEWLPTQ